MGDREGEEWDVVEVLANAATARAEAGIDSNLPATVEELEEGRPTFLSSDSKLRISQLEGYGNFAVEYEGEKRPDSTVVHSHPFFFFHVTLDDGRVAVYRFSMLDNSLVFRKYEKNWSEILSVGMMARAGVLAAFLLTIGSLVGPSFCNGEDQETKQSAPLQENKPEDEGGNGGEDKLKRRPVESDLEEDPNNDKFC